LKKDYDIRDEWLPFEIHPETPAGGVLLEKHLPHIDWDDLYRNLRRSGERYGLTFNRVTLLANSRMILEAGEFAREHGLYDSFHEAAFRAYFTDLEDIGDSSIICALAARIGLDRKALGDALARGRYTPVLQRTTAQAHRLGINSAPTFIINNRYSVVGAQPLEAFQDLLRRIGGDGRID
jgi:predicted DsbA family dithiol-disulfide isomerase